MLLLFIYFHFHFVDAVFILFLLIFCALLPLADYVVLVM